VFLLFAPRKGCTFVFLKNFSGNLKKCNTGKSVLQVLPVFALIVTEVNGQLSCAIITSFVFITRLWPPHHIVSCIRKLLRLAGSLHETRKLAAQYHCARTSKKAAHTTCICLFAVPHPGVRYAAATLNESVWCVAAARHLISTPLTMVVLPPLNESAARATQSSVMRLPRQQAVS
jgi:hypothetical protein